jgi:hypothetical protein
MNRHGIVFGLLVLAWGSGASAGSQMSLAIPEATLARAFHSGCSLVVAEVLEVYAKDRMYYYKPRIVRTIVAGDLEKEEAYRPPDLFAGASYGAALKPGSRYAMFIGRDYPCEFAWAFRDDVMEVNSPDEDAVRRLVQIADRIYAGTAIRQFRRTRPGSKPLANSELPALPDELASLCKQFREQSGRRTVFGRRIAESDLGSRMEDSNPLSSSRTYLPPKIPLSRQQVLALFGEPTWTNGWTYSWRCDDFVHAQEGGSEIGILSATFDKREIAFRILFQMQERSKWIRPAKPHDWFAELDGDPGGVARAFLEAMRNSDWDRALSVCSQAVQAKAKESDSAETFFRRFVPLEKLAFQPRGYGSRDGRIIEVFAEVSIDVPDAQWPVRWNWKLVRAGPTWLVDFELVPLNQLIQKEVLKSEYLNGGTRRPEMSEGDLTYVLTPVTSEFVIGHPMLLRLEMKNDGSDPVAYGRTSVTVNSPMLVTGPDGETIPYVDTSYQTAGGIDVILPGEVIILAGRYDVASQYRIIRPGRYTFQFRGVRPGRETSNVCEVEVRPGPLPAVEQMIERLLPILPAGWNFTRHLATQSRSDGKSVELIYVHLIAQRGGKGSDKGVLLLIPIGGDPAETDPWLKEQVDLWGLSPWGPVYARVTEADELWPRHRTEIAHVLDIETQ